MQQSTGLIRPHRAKLALFYRVVDIAVINGCLVVACVLEAEPWHERYGFAAATAALFFTLFAERHHLYRSWRIATVGQELAQLGLSWCGSVVGLLAVFFVLQPHSGFHRLVILEWWLLVPVVLALWRTSFRSVLRTARRYGRNSRRVAIVGANELGARLAKTVGNGAWMGLRLVGFFDDRAARKHTGISLSGNTEDLFSMAREGRVDILYITLPLRAEARVNAMIERLADTTVSVYLVPDFFVFDLLHARWLNMGEFPVVSVYESPFYGVEGWVKRCEDLLLCCAILLVVAVPMLLITAGVKLSSPGPVLYRQRRYGINGQEIQVLKFRTMTVCEDDDGVRQATRCDARITRLGALLRRTSLDELPQLFNVLRGDMSVIGPRPHAVVHNEQYRRLIKGYMLRHKVKPGITGWAQVNGWRGETDTLEKMRKRVEYDLDYIRNWSLMLDFKIFYLTLFHGFVGENAY